MEKSLNSLEKKLRPAAIGFNEAGTTFLVLYPENGMRYCHMYDDAGQAAEDYLKYQQGADVRDWEGHEPDMDIFQAGRVYSQTGIFQAELNLGENLSEFLEGIGIPLYMNPETGSVDTLAGWRPYTLFTGLIEVRKARTKLEKEECGEWIEVK